MYGSLIDWWWGNRVVSQGLKLPVLRLQPVEGLHAHGPHVVNIFHLSVKQLRKCASDTVYYVLQGETRDSGTARWLIYCLSCYRFSWPNCNFLLLLYVHILSIINSWTRLCEAGEAWDYKFSGRKKQAEDMGWQWGVCPGQGLQGSGLVTVRSRRSYSGWICI